MKPLFIFELANNHGGDVVHAIKIIDELSTICKQFDYNFAIKFQYRDLDNFIQKDAKNEGYVKRFNDTRLTDEQFIALKMHSEYKGFKTICTPFDEVSVKKIQEQAYDYIKIASCSLTDWSLLEEIAKTDLLIIASTASSSLEEIEQVVLYFKHRNKDLTLLHCIGEYPTSFAKLNMNRIDTLKEKFPDLHIGYSGHEEKHNFAAIKIAIAKGCRVFERHVNLQGHCNKYSLDVYEVQDWMYSAKQAFSLCGQKELVKDNKLDGLKRGAWLTRDIKSGEKVTREDVYYAIPSQYGQLLANDMGRYKEILADKDMKKDGAALEVVIKDNREIIHDYLYDITQTIKASGVTIPRDVPMELSHHEGIERFRGTGVAIIDCINREYCKKLLILLPFQSHPKHFHVKKEETFHILSGSMTLRLANEDVYLNIGDMYTIDREVIHGFSTTTGCIFEEISTTHFPDDSFYKINLSKDRKTKMELRLYG